MFYIFKSFPIENSIRKYSPLQRPYASYHATIDYLPVWVYSILWSNDQ